MRKRTCRKVKTQNAERPQQGAGTRIQSHPILTFQRGAEVRFCFEGQEMTGYEGETIAAALVANGVKLLRYSEKLHRPRGFFCAVGKCSSCLMVVDGRPNTMVCMEPLRQGVRVERQEGRGVLPQAAERQREQETRRTEGRAGQ
jgi:hypothetical protein